MTEHEADPPPPGSEQVTGPTAEEIRAIANNPAVHAAALQAAKDFLMTRPDLAGMGSDTAAAVIAMHGAVIFRTYLEMVGHDGLVPDIARG